MLQFGGAPFFGASGVDQVIASVKCNAAHFGVLDLESTDFGVHRIAFRALIDSKLFITGELWRSVQCSAIVGKVGAVLGVRACAMTALLPCCDCVCCDRTCCDRVL